MKKPAFYLAMLLSLFSGYSAAVSTDSDSFYILGAPRPILAVRQAKDQWVPAWFDLRIGVLISGNRSLTGLERFGIYVDSRKINFEDFPRPCAFSFIKPWGDYEKTFTGSGASARPPYSNLWATRYAQHGEDAHVIKFDNGTCKVTLEMGGPSEKYLKDYPGIAGPYLSRMAKTHLYQNNLGLAFSGKDGRITFSAGGSTVTFEFVIEHREETLGLGSYGD